MPTIAENYITHAQQLLEHLEAEALVTDVVAGLLMDLDDARTEAIVEGHKRRRTIQERNDLADNLTRARAEANEARTNWRNAEATARYANESKHREAARVAALLRDLEQSREEVAALRGALGRVVDERLHNTTVGNLRTALTEAEADRHDYATRLRQADVELQEAKAQRDEYAARLERTNKLHNYYGGTVATGPAGTSFRNLQQAIDEDVALAAHPSLGEQLEDAALAELKASAHRLTTLPENKPTVTFTGTGRMSPATRAKLAADNYTTSRTYIIGGPVNWPEVARAATIRADRAERRLARKEAKRKGAERALQAAHQEAKRNAQKLAGVEFQLNYTKRALDKEHQAKASDPTTGLALAADLLRLIAEHPHGIEVATENDTEVKTWDGHAIRHLDLGGQLTITGRRA